MKKIPDEFYVGGQKMETHMVDRCDDNSLGTCCGADGFIEIADKHSKEGKQSESSKVNTFYHELTHTILRTMGESELNDNEKFVCCFSSFLTEAMKDAYFLTKDEQVHQATKE
jgi:hypothetical protein